MPQFHIHSTNTDDEGYLWISGQLTEEGTIEPNHRFYVEDDTGKGRLGRINSVEGEQMDSCWIRIDKDDRIKFDSVGLEGRTAEIKTPQTENDPLVMFELGPARWWVGIATVLLLLLFALGFALLTNYEETMEALGAIWKKVFG